MSWKTAIVVATLTAPGLAQSDVRAQPGALQPTPGPGGGPVHELVLASDGDLFAFAGGLYRSADAGWSWQAIPAAPGTSRLAAGLASDVWAWGAGGLYRTLDDGISWTPLAAAPAGIRALAFASAQLVFAATSQGLFRSTDAGATWTLAPGVPAPDVQTVVSSPSRTSASAGKAIYCTEDGGATWTRVAELAERITALAPHPQGGYYAGVEPQWPNPPGGIHRVFPDGTTSLAGLESHYIDHLLVRPDGVVFAGSGGWFDGYNPFGQGIYRSADGSNPWTFVGCGGYVGALACGADGTVFAAMLEGFTDFGFPPACGVIMTSGPGTHWQSRNRGLGGATIFDLATSAAGVVYAASDWTISWTDNDGMSWNEVETKLPMDWPEEGTWQLAVHPDGTLFAANITQPLYRSADRGRTWTPLNAPGYGPRDVVITAHGSLLLGTGGNLWRSTDRGESWTSFNGSSSILSLAAGPLDRVAVSTYEGIVLGDNDATSWGPVLPTIGRAAFAPDEHSLYVANGNGVQRWVEVAGSWTSQPMPAFPDASEVAVDPEGRVYAASRASVAWMLPGDSAWQSLGGTTCYGWYIGQRPSLVFGSDGYLYFGTDCDGVYRSTTPLGSPTSVEDSAHGLLAAWGCTPNPARGASRLTFGLGRSSEVHVSVYDVRGRLVAKLANGERFAPGSHALPWIPAPGTPSGVYTYRVRAGDMVRGGRIVLIR